MKLQPVRTTISLSVAAMLLFLASCASAPVALPPVPQVPTLAGTYSGTLTVDGQALAGTLVIEGQGANHTFTFTFPEVGLVANGTGGPTESGFRADVPYSMTCPGNAVFTGRIEDEGQRLVGTFEANDCTGTMRGNFNFTRQG